MTEETPQTAGCCAAIKTNFTKALFSAAMAEFTLTHSAPLQRLMTLPIKAGELVMRRATWDLVRQFAVALALSAAAVGGMLAAAGQSRAADLTVEPVVVPACPPPEVVILYDEEGRPTVPARTPYYYCVTGTTLLPGQIPPPPEYCCG